MSKQASEVLNKIDSALVEIDQLIAAEKKAVEAGRSPIESILVLKRQGVSDAQIAQSVWGRRIPGGTSFEGPFVDEFGCPDFGLITRQFEYEMEVEANGSSTIPPVVSAGYVPRWLTEGLDKLAELRTTVKARLEASLTKLSQEPAAAA